MHTHENDETYEVEPLSGADIEKKTTVLRQLMPKLNGKPHAIDLYRFINFHMEKTIGFRHEVNSSAPGEMGKMLPEQQAIVLSNETDKELEENDGRARFTAAHEIGHAVLHSEQLNSQIQLSVELHRRKRKDLPAFKCAEWQANTFASELLMPKKIVQAIVKNVAAEKRIQLLVDTFVVSTEAARIRLEKLNLVG